MGSQLKKANVPARGIREGFSKEVTFEQTFMCWKEFNSRSKSWMELHLRKKKPAQVAAGAQGGREGGRSWEQRSAGVTGKISGKGGTWFS